METTDSPLKPNSINSAVSFCAFFRCSGVVNALAPLTEALRECLHLFIGFSPAGMIVLVLTLFGIQQRWYRRHKLQLMRA